MPPPEPVAGSPCNGDDGGGKVSPSSSSYFPVDSLLVRVAADFGGGLRPWAGPELGDAPPPERGRACQVRAAVGRQWPPLGRGWPDPAFLAGLWGRAVAGVQALAAHGGVDAIHAAAQACHCEATAAQAYVALWCAVLARLGAYAALRPSGALPFGAATISVNPYSGLVIDSYWNGGVTRQMLQVKDFAGIISVSTTTTFFSVIFM